MAVSPIVAIDISGNSPYSDLTSEISFNFESQVDRNFLKLSKMNSQKNYRALFNTWGNPINVTNSRKWKPEGVIIIIVATWLIWSRSSLQVRYVGINFDPSWSDNSSEIYEVIPSDILVANVQFPDNALLVGLQIHAKFTDTITVNVNTPKMQYRLCDFSLANRSRTCAYPCPRYGYSTVRYGVGTESEAIGFATVANQYLDCT